MRYASKRSYTWSANIAYSTGLMASDGCMQKDGRHLDLTSTDTDQLKNFSQALNRYFYIGKKANMAGQLSYRIQFSDVAYYDFLLRAGLTPAKSKTISKIEIPDVYYADFLRGVFDGDGSCYAYMDKRWKSSYMYYITFTSASPTFLNYLQSSNSRIFGTSPGSIRRSRRAYILSYAKTDTRKLFTAMYHSSATLYLERKYSKLLSFTKKS